MALQSGKNKLTVSSFALLVNLLHLPLAQAREEVLIPEHAHRGPFPRSLSATSPQLRLQPGRCYPAPLVQTTGLSP
jgi:hypothetical protein